MKHIIEFTSIIDLLTTFPDEQSCINHLESIRWKNGVVSPFNPESKVYKCKGNRYKCRETNKYFNVRTGTIFDDTKIPLQKWMMAIFIMSGHKKGISSHQLSRDIKVTQKSAWFMLHRIRYAFGSKSFDDNKGTYEADETYIGMLEKNKHKSKKDKHGGYSGHSAYMDKKPVVGLIKRDGGIVLKYIPRPNADNVQGFIKDNLKPNARVITDTHHAYRNMYQDYVHDNINHKQDKYVVGDIYTNTIEGFWSLLKRGIYGIYHHVSREHIQQYLNEFAYRHNTRKMPDNKRFNAYLSQTTKRLKYQTLITHE